MTTDEEILWMIPWPWDYHGRGKIFVKAKDKESALTKAKIYFADSGSYRQLPEWDNIKKVDGDVVEDGGCDC